MTIGSRLTLEAFLARAREAFKASGFDDPLPEARALVHALLGMDLARQWAHPDYLLTGEETSRLEEALARRLLHQPLAQIAGQAPFDGLLFQVNPQVLVPRPETELLVEEAFQVCRERADRGGRLHILDSFTGTGALGISLGRRLTDKGLAYRLSLADLSFGALDLARENARRHLPDASLAFYLCDIWPQEGGPYDLVTANPPYIPRAEIPGLMPEVSCFEPGLALDGGADGLDFYRRLAEEGAGHLVPDGHLVVELGAGQADRVAALFEDRGWKEERRVKDLAGHERLLGFGAPIVK